MSCSAHDAATSFNDSNDFNERSTPWESTCFGVLAWLAAVLGSPFGMEPAAIARALTPSLHGVLFNSFNMDPNNNVLLRLLYAHAARFVALVLRGVAAVGGAVSFFTPQQELLAFAIFG